MNRTTLLTTSLIGAFVATGCGGSIESAVGFAGRGPKGTDGAQGRLLSRSVGRVDVLSFMGVLDAVLVEQYGLSIERRAEQLNAAYYETEWARREPNAEEAATGVTGTRHRVVLQGRRLDSSTPTGSVVLFRMSMTVEHQVRTVTDTLWHPGAALDSIFLDRINALGRDLTAAAREALPQ